MSMHQRFQQQARWTRHIRAFLYEKAQARYAQRILEVGSGTGAILSENADRVTGKVYGLDINPVYLRESVHFVPSASHILGDTHYLPFWDNTFDLAYCHFLLLWVKDPYQVVFELKRVTRRGGYVIAMAEPDYGARIDYPNELQIMGKLQEQSLRIQGADPQIGRKLGEIFTKSCLEQVELGIIGAQWSGDPSMDDFRLEWVVLEDDLREDLSPEALINLRKIDLEATKNHYRILFVPTFYAIGMVC